MRIGAEVKPGDILVGKVTPKGETQLSPEEKLLRAIFGEKAGDVRDTSLRVPSGVVGVVIGAQVFAREGHRAGRRAPFRSSRPRLLISAAMKKWRSMRFAPALLDRISKLLAGEKTTGKLTLQKTGSVTCSRRAGDRARPSLTESNFELPRLSSRSSRTSKTSFTQLIAGPQSPHGSSYRNVFKERAERMKRGDELAPGVIKMVKVTLAIKRRYPGGQPARWPAATVTKRWFEKIVPEEDMPYLADGSPVDMILNPLGVPSRMNIGQLLEPHARRRLLSRFIGPEDQRSAGIEV